MPVLSDALQGDSAGEGGEGKRAASRRGEEGDDKAVQAGESDGAAKAGCHYCGVGAVVRRCDCHSSCDGFVCLL